MTTTIEKRPSTPAAGDATAARRLGRAVSVAAAVIATGAIYLIASAAGVDFTLTDPGKTSTLHLTLAIIVEFTVFCSLLGWATLAILEGRIRRAHTVWGALAGVVLLLSYVPIGIEHASTPTKIMLVLIHTAVAVALFPMLRRVPAPTRQAHRRDQLDGILRSLPR